MIDVYTGNPVVCIVISVSWAYIPERADMAVLSLVNTAEDGVSFNGGLISIIFSQPKMTTVAKPRRNLMYNLIFMSLELKS
ncbi:hypothetical protein ASF92_09505 [Pedobacter sp. Leaf176]|nr:hypothetical protein ASF92_09505 [Pedobacter sp. Leaf176]